MEFALNRFSPLDMNMRLFRWHESILPEAARKKGTQALR